MQLGRSALAAQGGAGLFLAIEPIDMKRAKKRWWVELVVKASACVYFVGAELGDCRRTGHPKSAGEP
jgi:hypothetical protein